MYTALTCHEGWQDLAARSNSILQGLRRDLERNPFDPQSGRDRSDELRAMIFGIQRVLDIPQRAIDAAESVTIALRRAGEKNATDTY